MIFPQDHRRNKRGSKDRKTTIRYRGLVVPTSLLRPNNDPVSQFEMATTSRWLRNSQNRNAFCLTIAAVGGFRRPRFGPSGGGQQSRNAQFTKSGRCTLQTRLYSKHELAIWLHFELIAILVAKARRRSLIQWPIQGLRFKRQTPHAGWA